ncbi:hypothetical protein ACJJTC_007592 [Scirpophaga incertulas]
MTRAAAASFLRAALLSPRPPRPRHVKLTLDGRTANRTGTAGTSWISGMSITQDVNLIAPDKILTHVHRYSSPHYNPHHHYHRWNHEPGGSEEPLYATKTVFGVGYIDENKRIGKENGKAGDEKVALQSTCHVALDSCIKDAECMTSLTPVLQKCHAMECDREGCMTALRMFYRKPGVHWNTEIAFCLCKKTDNREDSCMNAQERLHPACAQRPPMGSPLPACHTLAHACREDPECRIRLENYEQWCAVDAVTQGCAGSPAACRAAVVAVLGTRLRAACACRGTDFAQLYECLGWQRLLWLNPCVVDSQSDYHVKTYGSLLTTTPADNSISYMTVAPETAIVHRTTTHHRHNKGVIKADLELYRSAELAECTDLCVCEPSLQVSCKVACVPRAPCSSRLAHYSHAAPAYQAYRGRCYCYSGAFICMRPSPGEYKLPEGVYLLLGFSAVDEALLRPHTGLGAEDAVRLLQQYLYSVDRQGTNCTLTLFNISNENVIISASVPQREQEALKDAGEALLDREKEECIDVLKVVKSRINSQHEDISSHLLLSIFKIAEVDVVYPAPPSSAITAHHPSKILYIIILILTILYHTSNPFVNKKIVNSLSNLFDSSLSTQIYTILIKLACFKPRYICINEFTTILKEEFIDVIMIEEHNALASISAQNDSTKDVVVSVIDIDSLKRTIHIINAVNITIFDNFNVLVADAIISKYFSSDVYYYIRCTKSCDSKMLLVLRFGNIASSSYEIVKSVSLGLTLAVE